MTKKLLSIILAFVMIFSATTCGLTVEAASKNTIETSISKVESKAKGFKVIWKKRVKLKVIKFNIALLPSLKNQAQKLKQ